MFTRNDQLTMIRNIRVKEGESLTINCPFCGGQKKFSISKIDGKTLWNCYKASCGARGAMGGPRNMAVVKARIESSQKPQLVKEPLPLPKLISGISNHPDVVEYLQSVGSYEAVQRRLAMVGYSPEEHRVLFFMNGGTGAVGRALDSRLPKWKAFGDTEGCFTCGKGTTAVVVEDAASACSVGVLDGYTGIALLGTNISHRQKRQLMSYQRVILCLDKDASRKAILLLQRLEGLVPATVRFLEKDLKLLRSDQIRRILDESPWHSDNRLRSA